MTNKFKAGDRVRLTAAGAGDLTPSQRSRLAGVLTVKSCSAHYVYFTEGGGGWTASRFDHANPFRVGDKVRLKKQSGYGAGEVWTVASLGTRFGGNEDRTVTFTDGMWCETDAIELATTQTPAATVSFPSIAKPAPVKEPKAAPITVKTGDTVRGSEWKHEHPSYKTRNIEGVVSSSFGGIIQLQNGKSVWADNVELVKSAVVDTPCIVVRVDAKGRLEAAANPHIHPNRAAAETEAKRLADLNRGQDFRVYSFVNLGTARGAPVVKPAVQFMKTA